MRVAQIQRNGRRDLTRFEGELEFVEFLQRSLWSADENAAVRQPSLCSLLIHSWINADLSIRQSFGPCVKEVELVGLRPQ